LALAGPVVAGSSEHADRVFADRAARDAHLDRLGVCALEVNPDPTPIAAEGALWGGLEAHGLPAALDRLLTRLRANNSESLKALDRPKIPLRANASQNDIRRRVIRRKISSGTRSDAGRDRRDAFLGLAKTCAKLGIAFSDYLGARLLVPGSATIPFLPEIVSLRAAQPP